MRDERSNKTWQVLRASTSRWLLIVLVSFWVFIGTLYAGFKLDRWAYPNLQDRSGDAFLSLCVSLLLGIVSARLVARWTRTPTED
jgi:hypothetical protein